jgi:hypothetical protein
MRILLILIVIAAIFVVVQSQRHNCKWGEPGWFDCVIGKTAEAPAPAVTPAQPPAAESPAPEAPAPEAPAPEAPAQ